MAKIFRSFRLNEALATRLSVEAAKRRKWPNLLVEQALQDWFVIEALEFEAAAKGRGLSRSEALNEALSIWISGG